MGWYILRVISGREKRVKNFLNRRKDKNVIKQIMIPSELVVDFTKKAKSKNHSHNLYPGYVFVEIDLNQQVIEFIKKTPGVLNFLKDLNGYPKEMSSKDINQILNIKPSLREKKFTKGDVITIKKGPFNGFNGIIDDANNPRKVIILVMVFGRQTPVELDINFIEEVK